MKARKLLALTIALTMLLGMFSSWSFMANANPLVVNKVLTADKVGKLIYSNDFNSLATLDDASFKLVNKPTWPVIEPDTAALSLVDTTESGTGKAILANGNNFWVNVDNVNGGVAKLRVKLSAAFNGNMIIAHGGSQTPGIGDTWQWATIPADTWVDLYLPFPKFTGTPPVAFSTILTLGDYTGTILIDSIEVYDMNEVEDTYYDYETDTDGFAKWPAESNLKITQVSYVKATGSVENNCWGWNTGFIGNALRGSGSLKVEMADADTVGNNAITGTGVVNNGDILTYHVFVPTDSTINALEWKGNIDWKGEMQFKYIPITNDLKGKWLTVDVPIYDSRATDSDPNYMSVYSYKNAGDKNGIYYIDSVTTNTPVNYTYDFEEDAAYYPWYVGSNGWAWIGQDESDWPIGIDTVGVDVAKPIITLDTDQAFSGDQSVLISSTGAAGGYINFYPLVYKAGGIGYIPDNVTIKYHLYIPADSVLSNFQIKYIDGSWAWQMQPIDNTYVKDGNTGKWFEVKQVINRNSDSSKNSIVAALMQFATKDASYGKPLFYMDAVRVVDNETGRIYNADGTLGDYDVDSDSCSAYVAPKPATPAVTADDAANTVTGMADGMEYKLDDGNWTAYDADTFADLDFTGEHTLLVRIAALGFTPASDSVELKFTTNVANISLTDEATGIQIVDVPAGTTMTVTPVTEGDDYDTIEATLRTAYEDMLGLTIDNFCVYDIAVTPSTFAAPVTVKIPVPEGYTEENSAIFIFGEDGIPEPADFTIVDGNFVFETDHFSYYALAEISGEILLPAPEVTADDEANTVSGMDEYMEYNLDDAGWVMYDADAFAALDLSGAHTMLVRYAADEMFPASAEVTLTFTANADNGDDGDNGDDEPTVPPTDTFDGGALVSLLMMGAAAIPVVIKKRS